MLVFAEKIGFHKDDLLRESPLISEIPFDYKLKYHATVHQTEGGHLLTVAGAPETILALCIDVRRDGKNHPLSKSEKEEQKTKIISLIFFRWFFWYARHTPA